MLCEREVNRCRLLERARGPPPSISQYNSPVTSAADSDVASQTRPVRQDLEWTAERAQNSQSRCSTTGRMRHDRGVSPKKESQARCT